VRDITEYVKTLETLKRAEERYALVLSGMSIGVWDWDLKTGKMFGSERLRAIIGTAPRQHIVDYERFTGRIHQDDRQAVAERLRMHLEKREKFDVVYRMRVKDNQYVWVHTNGQAVWDESGKPVRMVGSVEDITQRHKLENNLVELVGKLKKSNKDLDEFAYAASHDLKAPLRVIDNTSQWLLEDLEPYLTQETRENMNLLRGRVMRMKKLLGDLLEYSRIGRTQDERFAQAVNGGELLENIIELLSPDGGFSVLSDSRFAEIEVMQMPLQQVLMNLISNAMKHHDKKTGTIKIGLADMGPVYEFTVEDDGPGIPAQFHDKIFEMFRTLRPRDHVEGSGMGLAMVRKNVEMFGGSITVQSGPGQGSRFRFTWPKSQPAWMVDA
jgi:PAS domain S-box-containing protein